jgi:hypothetical protein
VAFYRWLDIGAFMDRDEDRLAGFLRRCKVILSERLGLGAKSGCDKDGACGGCGKKRGAS